ncbi:MAG: hypothetical protein ERJ67_10080 [Aphanocapsa feldmannii 277cV]|uniref:Uncharacterized protein n=2 Tax=Aphanocapsa feldmannii TaxID=192050 RepID=A0A524RMU3_9CHRO|nr:MAG: hypothetical protein ERJ67_10080 [Aphanocapsa feldmannii 277cV]TGH21927.1 MAG: hypothetical protein ERJ68_05035 [Aphanocapsa feldmannii 277cI]
MDLFCCLNCAISELVSRSETMEITDFVGGEGTGIDAEGVSDGIREPRTQTVDHTGLRPERLEPACIHQRSDGGYPASIALDIEAVASRRCPRDGSPEIGGEGMIGCITAPEPTVGLETLKN